MVNFSTFTSLAIDLTKEKGFLTTSIVDKCESLQVKSEKRLILELAT